MKSWKPKFEEIDDALLKVCQEGYKVTLRLDDRNDAYACWFNPTGDDHPNNGLILSGRGSTPLKAVKQALYIHNLFEGDWANNYQQFKTEELDD